MSCIEQVMEANTPQNSSCTATPTNHHKNHQK